MCLINVILNECGQDLNHPVNGRTNKGILVLMVQISSTRYATHDLFGSSTHIKLHNFVSDLLFVAFSKFVSCFRVRKMKVCLMYVIHPAMDIHRLHTTHTTLTYLVL